MCQQLGSMHSTGVVQLPYQMHLQAGVEHATLSRIVVSLPQEVMKSSQDDEVDTKLQLACCMVTSLAAQNHIHCTVWATGLTSNRTNALVVCLHKAFVTKAFKSIYTEQSRLGLKLSTDIKAAVTLKPMLGQELQLAQATGVASILEGTGWQYLHGGLWLRYSEPLLLAAPGTVHSADCVQLCVPPPCGKAANAVVVTVQRAGKCCFTPISIARELSLAPSPASASEELQLLQKHVLNSTQALRQANRKLYNTVATLLPTCTHVFIKGLKLLHHPQEQHELLRKWSTSVPWLTPLDEGRRATLLSGMLVLEVSQDPDADTGDCTVWDVPAACCWTCAGLQHAPPSTTSQQEQQAALQQVEQSLTANAAGLALLWGGKPLQLSSLPVQDDIPTAPGGPAVCVQPIRGAAGQNMHSENVALSSQQLQTATQGAQHAASLWATAAHFDSAPTQTTQTSPHKEAVCQKDPAAAAMRCNLGANELPVHATSYYHSCRPLAVAMHSTNQGCTLAGEALMPQGPAQVRTVEPHITAIVAGRQARRQKEEALWSSLQPVLHKLEEEQQSHTFKEEERCKVVTTAAGVARRLGQPAKVAIAASKPTLAARVGSAKPAAVVSKAASKPATAATHLTVPAAPRAPTTAVASATAAVTKATLAGPSLPAANSHLTSEAGARKATVNAHATQKRKPAVAGEAVPAAEAAAGMLQGVALSSGTAVPAVPKQMLEAAKPVAGSAGGQPTAAAPARKRTKASDLDTAAVEAKVEAKAAAGSLSGLSIPEMQAWLRSRKMPVGGKKAELEARLAAALGLTQPSQA